MNNLTTLNTKFVDCMDKVSILIGYRNRINDGQGFAGNALSKVNNGKICLRDLVNSIDCSEYTKILDTKELCDSYMAFHRSMQEYTSSLSNINNVEQAIVIAAKNKLVSSQEKYDSIRVEIEKKYGLTINDAESIASLVASCMDEYILSLQKQIKDVKSEALPFFSSGSTVVLRSSDDYNEVQKLPNKMLIARQPIDMEDMPLAKAVGGASLYNDIVTDIREQGNVIVTCDYANMRDERIDDFVLAYIFKYIEAFPVGSINVHIFDKNANYVFKRFVNSFKTEDASDISKRTVQLHSDKGDLNRFRDVYCEDIFKKTSVSHPDLYSIYETDKSDVFNLIVIRDGIIDGASYSAAESLDILNSLTKSGDIGHRCGLRFLIIDSSETSDKNMTPQIKHLVNLIHDNCSTKLIYKNDGFYVDDQIVEILTVEDNLEVYIQNRTQILFNAINGRANSIVSVDDISDGVVETPQSIMYIPVGKSGDGIVELPFSCKDENGTVAGQCIGYMVIGQSGSGKSSFFHSLVINGCQRYSPKDLQFWLLDFKNGGASSKYINSGLPHIKMIAENNKIDDALCLFQLVLEEMERRSKAFNKNFSDNIVDYNRIAVEKNLEYFPRVIIAIDEIQEIFRDDNASVLQKMISSIATRMRSAGMHFVMVAQNLCDGKSYMLKDAFMPSVSGRVCFRVAADIPRSSGFDDEFVQRKQEITELKTGEAYIGYGKDTVKKVKLAFISAKDMSEKYFAKIKEQHSAYDGLKPLIIGSKQCLTSNTLLQGKKESFADTINQLEKHNGVYSAIIGEDAYRMEPLKLVFSQYENSSLLFLGNDKNISSSLCTSVALSLIKQNVTVHLLNGDRSRIRDDYESIPHPFMYMCQVVEEGNNRVLRHKLNELNKIIGDIYAEYLKRQQITQDSDFDDPEFDPLFMIVNDLFAIESFVNNEMIDVKTEEELVENKESESIEGFSFDFDIFGPGDSNKSKGSLSIHDNIQDVMETLVKNGWRYNIHMILAIKGSPSVWRRLQASTAAKYSVLFNTTEFIDQFSNSYFLKEMLNNISNENDRETMGVLIGQNMSKMRPIIYNMADANERGLIERGMKEAAE